jgi:hypothetical protein
MIPTRLATSDDELEEYRSLEYPRVRVESSETNQISIYAHEFKDETKGYFVLVKHLHKPISQTYIIDRRADLLSEFMKVAAITLAELINDLPEKRIPTKEQPFSGIDPHGHSYSLKSEDTERAAYQRDHGDETKDA